MSEYKPGDVVAIRAEVIKTAGLGCFVQPEDSAATYARFPDVGPWPDAVRMKGAVALLRRWVQIRVPEDLHPDLRAETVAFLTALPEREAKPQ